MGQALKKFGADERKEREIGPVIVECYDKFFVNTKDNWTVDEFYHAVCLTVEEINKKLGSTQFKMPSKPILRQAYEKHKKVKDKTLTKEEFQKILQDVIFDSGVTGIGAKDTLIYMFSVPVTALLLKQRLIPKAIPNEIFVPGVTSAVVFFLAKFNKI